MKECFSDRSSPCHAELTPTSLKAQKETTIRSSSCQSLEERTVTAVNRDFKKHFTLLQPEIDVGWREKRRALFTAEVESVGNKIAPVLSVIKHSSA